MFDLMHLSIIVVAGANFWPWIILNLIIAYVVLRPDFPYQALMPAVVATVFILFATKIVNVANLGWYDTGVNNKLFFEAVDATGKRYSVPTNFFAFYSYSFGHMDYGPPSPDTAFRVGSPNGGTLDYRLFKAGRSCDKAELLSGGMEPTSSLNGVVQFVQNYHRMIVSIEDLIRSFPYDLYPHHFYVPRNQSLPFRDLDKRRVVAYIYRQETVCLSFESGHLKRNVVATAERRINVD